MIRVQLSDVAFRTLLSSKANFKESYMATFYDYFNEQKYADAVKNVSVSFSVSATTKTTIIDREISRFEFLWMITVLYDLLSSDTVPGFDLDFWKMGSEEY